MCFVGVCHLNLVFVEERPDLHKTIAAKKQTNSHNFKIKNLNLLNYFLHVYLLNRGKSSYMNESLMRVNNTSCEIIDCYWRKHCRDSLAKLVPLFQMFLCFFFLTCSLIDRCQIVTDTCKNNVSRFVWKPFKSPLSLQKWKCFGEASLFDLHHLYSNYHLFTQKLFSLWRILLYLQQPVTGNHLGSFGKNFVRFKKINMLFTG